jgi:hypothetical protein
LTPADIRRGISSARVRIRDLANRGAPGDATQMSLGLSRLLAANFSQYEMLECEVPFASRWRRQANYGRGFGVFFDFDDVIIGRVLINFPTAFGGCPNIKLASANDRI